MCEESDSETRNQIRTHVQSAFKELRKSGFITRSNFSCCMSCAVAELADMARKAHRDRAVYWHRQDDQHFRQTGSLYIRFCHLPLTDEAGPQGIDVEIGKQIMEAFEKHRLHVEWNGNPNTTIRVLGVVSDEIPVDEASQEEQAHE